MVAFQDPDLGSEWDAERIQQSPGQARQSFHATTKQGAVLDLKLRL